jgi:transposase
MALGRRGGVEEGLWVPTTELPRSPGHPFYERVNRVLAEAGFDRFVEDLCRPHYPRCRVGRRFLQARISGC